MSYNKELETNRKAKQDHDEALKENASKRLRKNAAWNKASRSKQK